MARACSPRVEVHGEAVVIFDASGLGRVLGSPADIAREVSQLATGRGVTIRVALAPTSTAAWLLAHATPGATVVAGAEEAAAALSGLPLRWLATLPDYGNEKRVSHHEDREGHEEFPGKIFVVFGGFVVNVGW
jgi:hypothetical protein